MKDEYLTELKEHLIDLKVDLNIVEDVIEEYDTMIDEAVNGGMIPTEIASKFGTPERVAIYLGYESKMKRTKTLNFTSNNFLMPITIFICILFCGIMYLSEFEYLYICDLVCFAIPIVALLELNRDGSIGARICECYIYLIIMISSIILLTSDIQRNESIAIYFLFSIPILLAGFYSPIIPNESSAKTKK